MLPGFFEQTQTRIWLKGLLRIWCVSVAWLLGIRSYLLPAPEPAAEEEANPAAAAAGANGQEAAPVVGAAAAAAAAPAPPVVVAPPEPAPPRNLAAAHQAMMQRDGPVGYQPYERPTFLAVRLCALISLMCFSIVCAAMLMLTVPVYIGRRLMILWTGQPGDKAPATVVPGDLPAVDPEAARKNERLLRPHELYTAEIGGYLCWIMSRGVAVVVTLLPQGRTAIVNKMKHWARVALQYALPVLTLIGIFVLVPLLFGLLLELVVVIPLRVPLPKTPIHFLWQDWALGVLYTKIAIALTLMGPDWHLKRALERAYTDGLRDFDLKFVMRDLAVPVVTTFGLALAIPYVIGHSLLPIFFANPRDQFIIGRLVYPVSFIVVGSICFVLFQIKQLKKLYLSIKVDKYLVGQRLVNYEHRKKQQQAAAAQKLKARQAAEEAQQAQAQPADANAGNAGADPLLDLAEQAALHAQRRREQLPRPLIVDANEELL